MQRHRVLLAFGIAWLAALLLSYWVYTRTARPQTRDAVRVVAASKDLPIGQRILTEDLKLIEVNRADLPRGAFQKTADVVDRAVSTALTAGEVVLPSKLAAKGSGEGLTALIEPGWRAVSVQVNESSGVAGFIQPGTHVDVLFTRVFSSGDAATTTILQNIKVLAYGRQTTPSPRTETQNPNANPNANANANRVTVATLLVSQAEAERLVLAEQRGKIHFALRNGLDSDVTDATDPVQASDLGIADPRRPQPVAARPARVAAPPVEPPKVELPPPPPPPPPPEKVETKPRTVRIYRGDKLTEQELE